VSKLTTFLPFGRILKQIETERVKQIRAQLQGFLKKAVVLNLSSIRFLAFYQSGFTLPLSQQSQYHYTSILSSFYTPAGVPLTLKIL
jgi:hypothetical protein